jgi:hypothetical protein
VLTAGAAIFVAASREGVDDPELVVVASMLFALWLARRTRDRQEAAPGDETVERVA